MIKNLDNHPLDNFINFFASKVLLFFTSVYSLIAGICFSLVYEDPSYIVRFSSLITLSGLFLTLSPVFVRGIYKSQSGAGSFCSINKDGESTITNESDRIVGSNVFFGILLSIFGALTSSFGDLFFIKIINLT